MSQHSTKRTLPHPAFPRQNKHFMSDRRKPCCYMGDIGVGTFGCGGADGLVGAAGAGIGLAGLLRVRAGTVF
jgi:hypothetical protein